MSVVVGLATAALLAAAALCVIHAMRPGTVADRAVTLDTVVATTICALALGAVASGDGLFADLALVLALVGFIATTTVSRYVHRRGL